MVSQGRNFYHYQHRWGTVLHCSCNIFLYINGSSNPCLVSRAHYTECPKISPFFDVIKEQWTVSERALSTLLSCSDNVQTSMVARLVRGRYVHTHHKHSSTQNQRFAGRAGWKSILEITTLFWLQECRKSNHYTTKILNTSPLLQTWLQLRVVERHNPIHFQLLMFLDCQQQKCACPGASKVPCQRGQPHLFTGIFYREVAVSVFWVQAGTPSATPLALAFPECLHLADAINNVSLS